VFGVSLSKCLRHDAQRHGRQVSVSPSSESSLLDALSLQSASTSRLTVTPRLSAQRLYDEHYCSMLLQVPQIVRTCCHHLKTHGNYSQKSFLYLVISIRHEIYDHEFVMSPLRRLGIFVCFMAKSVFWVFFGPSSVKGVGPI